MQDIATVGAVMLWPNEPEKQKRSLQAFYASKPELISDGQTVVATAADLQAFASVIREAPSLEAMARESERPFSFGFIAGKLLEHSVGFLSIDPSRASVSRLKKELAARFAKHRISVKTIDQTIWPQYRAVAHLWAAYIFLRSDGPKRAFPCKPGELGTLLATAEIYRHRGETLKVSRSPEPTILRPGEAATLPEGISWLPVVQLNLSAKTPSDYSKSTDRPSGKDGSDTKD